VLLQNIMSLSLCIRILCDIEIHTFRCCGCERLRAPAFAINFVSSQTNQLVSGLHTIVRRQQHSCLFI
jgi:predicted Fe-S protein YdhL (DUF1289 family)